MISFREELARWASDDMRAVAMHQGAEAYLVDSLESQMRLAARGRAILADIAEAGPAAL